MPNRRNAASRSRQTITTAREPMCFCSQITFSTCSLRKYASASAACSNSPGCLVVSLGDIVNVENIILLVLLRQGGRGLHAHQRLRGLVVGPMRWCGHELLLRVTKRGQLAAKHTASVDVDCAVQPLRLGNRRVPVHHHGLAAIIGCPVVAHREAELICFSLCLAKQRAQ